MAKILIKKSTVAAKTPVAGDLDIGELAVNTADAKLFTKHNDNSVKEISPPETSTTAGALINSATAKTTPVDADMVGLMDSAASNMLKKLSWNNIKTTLKAYFDSIYATGTIPVKASSAEINTGSDDTKFVTPSALKNSNQTSRIISIRLLDKSTDLVAATSIGGDFRIPFACTILGVGAYVDVAGTALTTINIKEAGTTILGTKITIDASEKSTSTAATPATITDSSLAADAILTIDIDSVSGTVPKGLTVWLKIQMN